MKGFLNVLLPWTRFDSVETYGAVLRKKYLNEYNKLHRCRIYISVQI